ncbi:MAG: saccharopine dehydrogenase NADP-binding domain-containing protein [Chitinophagaceae bacterium]|nr:saccharopine dehydrogenase NADP-binding domain-containing protein [Chitinophagaceae bacterium]
MLAMKIAVLGAGMVGRAIALDLADQYAVTSFDLHTDQLDTLRKRNPAIQTKQANLRETANYSDWLAPFDLVVTAVPGMMGYACLEAVIKSGKNVVDISFFPEDVLQLNELAKQMDVTVITDCGVAPGMSNLILGRYNATMKIDSFACYVGGLPLHPRPPFFYKAPFSPIDVIQEYIRPARLLEKGRIVTKPAMTDREMLDFGKAGQLEAFNTDGLRSLLFTMGHIPELKEKTLRYPGHLDLIIALEQSGFLSETPVQINDTLISPLDLSSQLLLREWKLEPDEEEFTVMKVILQGDGQTITYDLYDQYDPATQTSSMARTTGYTCTAAVNLITRGLFAEKGVFPPELIGHRIDCFNYVLEYLAERNVNWKLSVS